MILLWVLVSVAVALFAVFPLTDTDIWWHLACAREWVTTWTPVREPVVNVHEFFQQTVLFVYNIGGAPLLVAFKAALWGGVFALFLRPCARHFVHAIKRHSGPMSSRIYSGTESPKAILPLAVFTTLLFIFRYQFEIRPVLFSLLFLGVYWNVLPWIFEKYRQLFEPVDESVDEPVESVESAESAEGRGRDIAKIVGATLAILVLQWLWCKCQGLYILGPIFSLTIFALELWNSRRSGQEFARQSILGPLAFVLLLFAMPFFHCEGLNLFLYPFGLLDRLLGLSPSAAVFASEIAENRSPITLLMAGENVLQSVLMVVLCIAGIVFVVHRLRLSFSSSHSRPVILEHSLSAIGSKALWLFITAILAFIAERNFVLFLPVFFAWILRTSGPQNDETHSAGTPLKMTPSTTSRLSKFSHQLTKNRPLPTSYFLLSTILIAFLLGFWLRSVSNYDSMIAYQRVPVAAAEWMKSHPHSGRLFNDDRVGGYLAFVNPSDSTYIDGRFILKTAEFFEHYLAYAQTPQLFLQEAELQNIDRVVLPLRYYARWDKLLAALDSAKNWHVAYRDSFFVVMDRTEY